MAKIVQNAYFGKNGTARCAICSYPLSDPESIIKGIGWRCKHGSEHSGSPQSDKYSKKGEVIAFGISVSQKGVDQRISVRQLSEVSGVSYQTLINKINSGEIISEVISGQTYVTKRSFNKLIEKDAADTSVYGLRMAHFRNVVDRVSILNLTHAKAMSLRKEVDSVREKRQVFFELNEPKPFADISSKSDLDDLDHLKYKLLTGHTHLLDDLKDSKVLELTKSDRGLGLLLISATACEIDGNYTRRQEFIFRAIESSFKAKVKEIGKGVAVAFLTRQKVIALELDRLMKEDSTRRTNALSLKALKALELSKSQVIEIDDESNSILNDLVASKTNQDPQMAFAGAKARILYSIRALQKHKDEKLRLKLFTGEISSSGDSTYDNRASESNENKETEREFEEGKNDGMYTSDKTETLKQESLGISESFDAILRSNDRVAMHHFILSSPLFDSGDADRRMEISGKNVGQLQSLLLKFKKDTCDFTVKVGKK